MKVKIFYKLFFIFTILNCGFNRQQQQQLLSFVVIKLRINHFLLTKWIFQCVVRVFDVKYHIIVFLMLKLLFNTFCLNQETFPMKYIIIIISLFPYILGIDVQCRGFPFKNLKYILSTNYINKKTDLKISNFLISVKNFKVDEINCVLSWC